MTISHGKEEKKRGKAFIRAIKKGNKAEALSLIKAGIDPNAHDKWGRTVLHFAAENDFWDEVRTLISEGAHANNVDWIGRTVLMIAAEAGNSEIVQLLLDKGSDPNLQDSKEGYSALMQAAMHGHEEIVKTFLAAGADPKAKTKKGWPTAFLASKEGHTPVVRVLLDAGVDVNADNEAGQTLLMAATMSGHTSVVRMLIDAGADVNARDKQGVTALFHAAAVGDGKILEELIDKGADVNAREKRRGTTPLMEAAVCGHVEIAKKLLAKGADARMAVEFSTLTASHSHNAASIAERRGHYELAKLLTEAAKKGVPKVPMADSGIPVSEGRLASSIGIETINDVFTALIESGTSIPCERREIFSTSADNQTEIELHVLQGLSQRASENISLGKFKLTGLPKGRRGEPKIEVTFQVQLNSEFLLTARDLENKVDLNVVRV